MTGALFAFLAVIFAGLGARDQLTVAMLSARLGQRWSLLALAATTSVATAIAVAWAAQAVAPFLPGKSGLFLAGSALAIAAGEMLLFRAQVDAAEPTRSLGAAGIVLLAHQLTDAARFLIFAVAAATSATVPAAAGGALGGVVVVAIGWGAGADLLDRRVSPVRRVLGLLLLPLAAWIMLRAMGRI